MAKFRQGQAVLYRGKPAEFVRYTGGLAIVLRATIRIKCDSIVETTKLISVFPKSLTPITEEIEMPEKFSELCGHLHGTEVEVQAEAAYRLIERAALAPAKLAWSLRESSYLTHEQCRSRAVQALEALAEFFEEGPDPYWWRDYYLLTGVHVILTDEGWEPGESKEIYVADDPTWEPLDELNAPEVSHAHP